MTPIPAAQRRYSAATIALHWIMLLLLVAVFATIEGREYFPRGSATREALKGWHFMLGLSVLALVGVRIAARLAARRSPRPRGREAGERVAAAMHWLLYAFMILMPLAGWIILSSEGDPIPFFGTELPPIAPQDAAMAERIESLHGTIGEAGYYLIGLHAAAALFHHYVVRDSTLARMLPWIRIREA